MTVRWLALALTLSLSMTALAQETASTPAESPAPTAPVPIPENMDLYLLVGQSNMAGRGLLKPSDKLPSPGIYVLDKEGAWKNQGEPFHFDKPEAGAGLSLSFALAMQKLHPDPPIGLIPCAVGGTPQIRWMPEGDLYEAAVKRAKIAQQRGQLKAILWHQGESESGKEESAQAYGANLAKIVAGFRKDLNAENVPFIAGELGEFLSKRPGPSAFYKVVNEQIQLLPTLAPRTATVSAQGLTDKGDNLHFSTQALRELGDRYAEALQKLEAPPSR